jgi:hypothetical protein
MEFQRHSLSSNKTKKSKASADQRRLSYSEIAAQVMNS